MPEIRIVEDLFYQKNDRPDQPAKRIQCDSDGNLWLPLAEGFRIFKPLGWTLLESKPRETGDEELR